MVLNKVSETRENKVNENILKTILVSLAFGFILGILSKILDSPSFNPIFSDITSRLGIWVFIATLLSVYSSSPKIASIKVFSFFVSLMLAYYGYSEIVLNIFPRKVIMFWGICSIISPICAYVMWYACGENWRSDVVLSLPIAVLLTEGWGLRNAYLPIHTHYYLVPILMIIYFIMISILLYVIPTKNKQRIFVILISILLSCILLYFNVLGIVFGGMNSML